MKIKNQVTKVARCNIYSAMIEYFIIAIADGFTGEMIPDKIVYIIQGIYLLRVIYNIMLIIFNEK